MTNRRWLPIVVLWLAACGSTQPQTLVPATPRPASTPSPVQSSSPVSAAPSRPTSAVATGDAVVTDSMARLALTGESYAVLGDPAAPLTVVEFSDYG